VLFRSTFLENYTILPRDARCAELGIGTLIMSVRLSSVCLSVTLTYRALIIGGVVREINYTDN